MRPPFPDPMTPASSRGEVLLGYVDYFRAVLVDKVTTLPEHDLRSSRLPSGWTPIELLKHVAYMEMRWVEWRFEGHDVVDPWGDQREGRWFVGSEETLADLLRALEAQAGRTREVVQAHALSDVGRPSLRWDGGDPATLERILLHLLQEYARHVGHVDIVRELVDGVVGE